MTVQLSKPHRPLSAIMLEVYKDWRKPYYGAIPYIDALYRCHSVSDTYGCESVADIVRYFLANAGTWRGETARRIKAELRTMLEG